MYICIARSRILCASQLRNAIGQIRYEEMLYARYVAVRARLESNVEDRTPGKMKRTAKERPAIVRYE